MNGFIKKHTVIALICSLFLFINVQATAQNKLSPYVGKYKMVVNGYEAHVDVFIKDNKLRAKQSWDGKTRTFEYVGDNKFIIAMDGWAIQFIRNKANKVIKMQVLGSEIWTKV